MSRFSQVEKPAEDKSLSNLYQDMLDQGFGNEVPINWLTSQSTRPDILAGTWEFSKGMLLQGELPMIVKQMVAVTISARNNCLYCRELHGHTLSMLGVSEDIIASCVADPELAAVQQPHRGILEFAVKVAKTPAAIDAEDLQSLRSLGITQSEILELIALSAYCNFINTWADISCVRTEG
jgi:uncharacterized peroxidase-related enzyme